MTTINNNTPPLAPQTDMDFLQQLYDQTKEGLGKANDPMLNQYLTQLLGTLYKAQKNMGILTAPEVPDTSNLSTADIVALLMTETRKTNNLVATSTIFQVQAQQKNIIANNEAMAKKMEEADKKLSEANDLKDGLDIFKWVMLAVSVLLLVLSIVATCCTFGAAWPTIVASVAVLAISVSLFIVSTVPVDDENNTAMDLATKELSEAIAAQAKKDLIADLKDKNKNWDTLSDEEQQDLIAEAEATGAYSAIAIMITIQVIIAIAMILATAGVAAGTAATTTASAAANATAQVTKTALDAAKNAILANMATIQLIVGNMQVAGKLVQSAGQIASGSVQIVAAEATYEGTITKADADRMKALSAFLTKHNALLLEIVQDLFEDVHDSYENVASIIREEHRLRERISQLMEGAMFA